ncbi:hypothetical protein DCC85_05585 [Paenibacillus sp. CAA11]|uniref:hypothetical protein n=1 Tax=Paenibacillus sp. CAA11 TaxID=1532905 RepID=UPI000D3B3C45|nr:hypothetical protein [Paenibacillus sp. CAA11]AWB43743.1 hypothetical protein DCC85_05585 [Paenibacillus sp. CAA11]
MSLGGSEIGIIVILTIAAALSTACGIFFTSKQKKKRRIYGLIQTILPLLLFLPLTAMFPTIEGSAIVLVFCFWLLVGGLIVLIASFFTGEDE